MCTAAARRALGSEWLSPFLPLNEAWSTRAGVDYTPAQHAASAPPLTGHHFLVVFVHAHYEGPALVAVIVRLAQLHVLHRRQFRLVRRVPSGHGAMVVLDDGDDASVEGGHQAQVRSRQPAKRRALEPPTLGE
eukprot:scaffold32213_cov58-Phaeocystis_antarctica.AAC.5